MTIEEKSPGVGQKISELLKHHVNLATLEWEYSKQEWRRLLLIRGGAALLVVFSFALFNISLFWGLYQWGFSIGWATFIVGFFYLISATALFYLSLDREDPQVRGFSESESEIKRSLEWIEKYLS